MAASAFATTGVSAAEYVPLICCKELPEPVSSEGGQHRDLAVGIANPRAQYVGGGEHGSGFLRRKNLVALSFAGRDHDEAAAQARQAVGKFDGQSGRRFQGAALDDDGKDGQAHLRRRIAA